MLNILRSSSHVRSRLGQSSKTPFLQFGPDVRLPAKAQTHQKCYNVSSEGKMRIQKSYLKKTKINVRSQHITKNICNKHACLFIGDLGRSDYHGHYAPMQQACLATKIFWVILHVGIHSDGHFTYYMTSSNLTFGRSQVKAGQKVRFSNIHVCINSTSS